MIETKSKALNNKINYLTKKGLIGVIAISRLVFANSSSAQAPSSSCDKNTTASAKHHLHLVEVDINQEVEKRSQWLVNRFLSSSAQHLKYIKQASLHGSKSSYVKNNFFDAVYPAGRLSGRDNYCIAAINRFLQDANEYGDFSAILPNPSSSDAPSSVECHRFANFIEQKELGEYVDRGYLNISSLEAGDIVMTPRGGGRMHATIYIGNKIVRSFNNDGEWPLKPQSNAIVIKTGKIFTHAIFENLKKEGYIKKEDNPHNKIMSFLDAKKLADYLYQGRSKNNSTQLLAQAKPEIDFMSYYLGVEKERRA